MMPGEVMPKSSPKLNVLEKLAEGDASEETVNDNLFTAYNFLTQVSERGGSGRGREVSTARGADELLHDGDEDTTPLYLTSLFNPTSRSHK
jgi:hypothetical protein